MPIWKYHSSSDSEVKIADEVINELAVLERKDANVSTSKRKTALWRELANNASVAPAKKSEYLEKAISEVKTMGSPSSILLYLEFYRPSEGVRAWFKRFEIY